MKKTLLTVLLTISAISLIGCDLADKKELKTSHSGIKAGEYIKNNVDTSSLKVPTSPSATKAGEYIKDNVNIEKSTSAATIVGQEIQNNKAEPTKSLSKVEKSKEELKKMISDTTFIQYGSNLDNATVIFFDPQCIHCHNLFMNSQNEEFKDETFVWIPLAYLNDNSLLQSITILSSENPQEALIKHENLYKENNFGIETIKIANQEISEAVLKNNEAFKNTKFSGVPVLLKVGKDGSINVEKGGLPTDLLKEFINK